MFICDNENLVKDFGFNQKGCINEWLWQFNSTKICNLLVNIFVDDAVRLKGTGTPLPPELFCFLLN